MALDATGRDGTGRDGTGRDGTGRDGTGRDGTGRDGTQRAPRARWAAPCDADCPPCLARRGNGKSVEFLTTDKVLFKFYEKFILGKKSEYIDDDGNVIKVPGAQYEDNGVRKLY